MKITSILRLYNKKIILELKEKPYRVSHKKLGMRKIFLK